MNAHTPQFNAHGTVDLIAIHPEFGEIPFTASPDDCEAHGRDLYARAIAGEFGPIAPYIPPTPTPEQIIAQYESALDAHLDGVAQAHRFKDRHSLALRAGYLSAYQPLGLAFAQWMDGCNAQSYTLLQEVIDGTKPLPTIKDFIAGLPGFVAP